MATDPVQDSTTVAPLGEADQLRAKIMDLQSSMQRQAPNYEHLLHTIHSALARSPDTVHLLSDEEIGVIVAGLSKKTNVVISAQLARKKDSLKGVTLNDL